MMEKETAPKKVAELPFRGTEEESQEQIAKIRNIIIEMVVHHIKEKRKKEIEAKLKKD